MSNDYNDRYTHEALHTAYVLIHTWDKHVIDTRCCDQFPDVKEAAEKASTAMSSVYQLIGQKFDDGEEGESSAGTAGKENG